MIPQNRILEIAKDYQTHADCVVSIRGEHDVIGFARELEAEIKRWHRMAATATIKPAPDVDSPAFTFRLD